MDIATFVSLVDGGFVGVRKLVGTVAYKSVRRWFAMTDNVPPDDISQFVRDATEHCLDEALDRVSDSVRGFDPSKGAASTWIYNTCWFVAANWCRDNLVSHVSDMGQADGESKRQGATDRFHSDHGIDRRPQSPERAELVIREVCTDPAMADEFAYLTANDGKRGRPRKASPKFAERVRTVAEQMTA